MSKMDDWLWTQCKLLILVIAVTSWSTNVAGSPGKASLSCKICGHEVGAAPTGQLPQGYSPCPYKDCNAQTHAQLATDFNSFWSPLVPGVGAGSAQQVELTKKHTEILNSGSLQGHETGATGFACGYYEGPAGRLSDDAEKKEIILQYCIGVKDDTEIKCEMGDHFEPGSCICTQDKCNDDEQRAGWKPTESGLGHEGHDHGHVHEHPPETIHHHIEPPPPGSNDNEPEPEHPELPEPDNHHRAPPGSDESDQIDKAPGENSRPNPNPTNEANNYGSGSSDLNSREGDDTNITLSNASDRIAGGGAYNIYTILTGVICIGGCGFWLVQRLTT